MVTGTGIKNKVLEAMALGRPVVTTPFGTQGISITPGVQLSVEMSAEGFAARVIELLGSPELRQTMGHAARDFVARHHSWAGVTDAIDGLYQVLVGNSHGRHAA
jgi:glycosyltransferase involved in cell wall biosynthesis